MKIIKKGDLVVAKGTDVEVVENGIKYDGTVLALVVEEDGSMPDLVDYTIVDHDETTYPLPDDFEEGKYNLVDNVFTVSPVWTNRLEALIQDAIDDYTLSLIEGGQL